MGPGTLPGMINTVVLHRFKSASFKNKLIEIIYLFTHFQEPEAVFVDLFELPRSITIF